MKTKIAALFLATSMIFATTAPEAVAFEKIDRAIMNMIRNIGGNRGARETRRPNRVRRARRAPVQPAAPVRSV